MTGDYDDQNRPSAMSIFKIQKYIHNMCVLELNTVCQYVQLFPSSEATNLKNYKFHLCPEIRTQYISVF